MYVLRMTCYGNAEKFVFLYYFTFCHGNMHLRNVLDYIGRSYHSGRGV